MNAIRSLLGALVFAGVLGYALYAVAPGLIRDWNLRNDYVAVPAEVTGECSVRAAVLNHCDLTLTPPTGAAQKEVMFFVDLDRSELSITPIAAPANPAVMSTSIGIEKYWNRVATLAGLAIIALLLIFSSLRSAFRKEEPQA